LHLQEALSFSSCSVRIHRQHENPKVLQELCQGEELLLHNEVSPVDSLHEITVDVLEEAQDQLPAHGFPQMGPALSANQDLVLQDQDDGWASSDLIHEACFENGRQEIVSPGPGKSSATRCARGERNRNFVTVFIIQDPVVRQVEALAEDERRPQ